MKLDECCFNSHIKDGVIECWGHVDHHKQQKHIVNPSVGPSQYLFSNVRSTFVLWTVEPLNRMTLNEVQSCGWCELRTELKKNG